MKLVKTIASCFATLAVVALTNSCARSEGPDNVPNSETKIDHLIIKEVSYLGHYWEKDNSSYGEGFGISKQMYEDDQYIIVYNPTNQVQYLDGMAIAFHAMDPERVTSFAANMNFTDKYYGIAKMMVFPGSGQEHAIAPGKSIVIAKYAQDHKKLFEEDNEGEDMKLYKGYDQFPDLSKADFEWTNNEFDKEGKNNPNVPDLVPIATGVDKKGYKEPYLMFTDIPEHCGLALIKTPWTSEDFKKNQLGTKEKPGYTHLISSTDIFGDFYATEIPFDNVVDAITICPKKRFQMSICKKMDKGYNGVTDDDKSQIKKDDLIKFSGLALTRKFDGKKFSDANNSTQDFEVKPCSLAREKK